MDVGEDVDPSADALVVPGQGHFGSCVVNLGARLSTVRAWINDGRPYFGICLGLQVLFDSSEESPEPGASIFAGEVLKLPATVKVPHIGWNEVRGGDGVSLFDGIEPLTRFYFVHSYYPKPSDDSVVAATTIHGIGFACAVARDNVVATQFHPEKSGEAGHQLLQNFVGAL